MSNRLSSGEAIVVFSVMLLELLYLPLGLVAAITVVRVSSLHTRPALATLNVCCSIASCIVVRS